MARNSALPRSPARSQLPLSTTVSGGFVSGRESALIFSAVATNRWRFKMAEFLYDYTGEGELENAFQNAAEFVKKMRNLTDEKKLAFYGLFKQVCVIYQLKCVMYVKAVSV